MFKVFIDGKAGTTGLRIYDRLKDRDDIELITLDESVRKDPAARSERINASDVTFLCLPDDAAREAVSFVNNDKTIIIDASTAHRTESGWSYGFAELSEKHREAIRNGKRIAVPGCHAGGFVALVYPLVKEGVIPTDYPISCFSITGYSGGGNKMIADYDTNDDFRLKSPRQYAVGQKHKHLKEMKAITGIDDFPLFSPIVSGFYSGMEVTVPLMSKLLKDKASPEEIAEIYSRYYNGSELVRCVGYSPENVFLASNELTGKDTMEIGVYGNSDRILLISRFDNLGKGASGAAIQCMNLSLGLPETAGLVLGHL
ncbi:MAG: N-acetyl-gamma-glutamyl-phosphate reductase [Clostridiales bacterium]|nr:N-acetyl-gamma-glutamyl-phosphate reductase [Clostridiales bacterium]